MCKTRKLTVNVVKSKMMNVSKNREENEMNFILDGRRVREVNAIDIWE